MSRVNWAAVVALLALALGALSLQNEWYGLMIYSGFVAVVAAVFSLRE